MFVVGARVNESVFSAEQTACILNTADWYTAHKVSEPQKPPTLINSSVP
jgi:hypothetical protein